MKTKSKRILRWIHSTYLDTYILLLWVKSTAITNRDISTSNNNNPNTNIFTTMWNARIISTNSMPIG
jgi:hypothetical protein